MKIKKLSIMILFFLLASIVANSSPQTTSLEQTVGGSTMISGVLAHEMTAAEAQTLANSNITWVSCDVTFNPSDISEWYQVYSLAQKYNLSVMGILDQHLMNYNNTFTLTDWNNSVTQAVLAFGSVVKTWEIWNEPSIPQNYLGYYNGTAQAYVSMLQTAYDDIKSIAPSDTVIGLGGVPLYTSDEPTLSDTYAAQAYNWTQQVVKFGGMSYCDAIAVHAYPYGEYYPSIAGFFFSSYLRMYSQLCGKPIWVTEVGQESYSTTWPATETQQSTFLAQSYSLFQGLGVKAYIWYELNDNYTAIPDSNFGLFDSNGNQKQAFDTFVDEVNGLTVPTPTPTPTPAAPPTQNPTAIPTSSTSPSPSPPQSTAAPSTPKPTPVATPISTPEEKYGMVLIAGSIVALIVAISVYIKKHPLPIRGPT